MKTNQYNVHCFWIYNENNPFDGVLLGKKLCFYMKCNVAINKYCRLKLIVLPRVLRIIKLKREVYLPASM